MGINPQIFREYDIRGIVAHDLGGDTAELIGRAFATEVRKIRGQGELTVAIGCDNRPSSPDLKEGVIKGVLDTGVHVIDVGTVPTPVLYFATERFETDGGLQITGSHNPPEYNGFKMVVKGRAVYGDAIQGLREMIDKGDFASGVGERDNREIIPQYIEDLTRRFKLKRQVKVVADCGNGTGSLVAVDLLRGIGADVTPLYCESDGTFPNHHPDPTVDENMQRHDRAGARDRRGDRRGLRWGCRPSGRRR